LSRVVCLFVAYLENGRRLASIAGDAPARRGFLRLLKSPTAGVEMPNSHFFI
jgi:hypothetical protein